MAAKTDQTQEKFFDDEVSYFLSKQEENSFHAQRVMNKFLSLVRRYPHTHVLEIGAGIGTYSLPLLREGSSVTALDISAKSLEIYQALARKENLLGNLTLLCQRAEDLESTCMYDMVLTRHVVHHVESISEVARRIHRSLRQDGVAIFLEPNPLCLYWYPYLTFHPHRSWKVEHGIFRCFPWMLVRHFQDAGFREIELLHYGAFPPFVVNKLHSLIALEERFAGVPWLRHFLALTLLKVKK